MLQPLGLYLLLIEEPFILPTSVLTQDSVNFAVESLIAVRPCKSRQYLDLICVL